MISAAEKRVALVSCQLAARSGLTRRERRALNREANILRRWLSPDAETPRGRHAILKSIKNAERPCKTRITMGRDGVMYNRYPKPSKRRAREARRDYREQHTLEKRPDYTPSPVISVDGLKRLRHLFRVEKAKQAWFEKKHSREVQGNKLAEQIA